MTSYTQPADYALYAPLQHETRDIDTRKQCILYQLSLMMTHIHCNIIIQIYYSKNLDNLIFSLIMLKIYRHKFLYLIKLEIFFMYNKIHKKYYILFLFNMTKILSRRKRKREGGGSKSLKLEIFHVTEM